MHFKTQESQKNLAKYEIPRPEGLLNAEQKDAAERVAKALKRAGKNRGKRIQPEKAAEIQEMMERIGAWGGW